MRYHQAGVLEFARRSAQLLMTLLGIHRGFKPAEVEIVDGADTEECHDLITQEIADAASLPIHLFRDHAERNRKRVSHLMLVGNGLVLSRAKNNCSTLPPMTTLFAAEAKPYSVIPAANRWRRCPSTRTSANN